eukprot:TRINITY_DN313_c0_g1_i1.p1 TRINITY_DN313_c0_g1~~TRINITY_DN313_c0_g1_i1.p1  ORF type:complete len:465 (+),score=163.98 TRINITY_DN313_c0_g1_i1:156-1550(+)
MASQHNSNPSESDSTDSNRVVSSSGDLTFVLSEFLDRHLLILLLQFLELKKSFPEDELLKAKLDLLAKTNMVDFEMDIYKQLYKTEDVPAELKSKRTNVVGKLRELQTLAAPILRILEDAALMSKLRNDKLFTAQYLEEKYDVKPENVDALYRYAKFQFECGNYSGAADCLHHYRMLDTSNDERNFSALWGKFAANILENEWEESLKDLNHLKDLIDSKNFTSPLKQLQQRTWLIHWSLFVFFNHPNGRNAIIDLFFSDKYLNAIQTACPHILRYLTAAVITNKRRRNMMKDMVKVIQQECYTYKDPITEFIEALYVNFDFEGAQVKLRECERLISNDFFLVSCKDDFIENARLFIFETYCRIHQCIDIGMLADKLNMDTESAERWIVNLIRNAKLDAKIDSKANTVIMGTQYPSVYQKVIEKTKGLSFRSSVLANNLAKTEQQRVGGGGFNDEESEQPQEVFA